MKKKQIILTVLFLSIGFHLQGNMDNIKIFQTINDINQYLSKQPEYPKASNKNWIKPDYSSFYKKQTKTAAQKAILNISNFFGIKKITWSTSLFKKLLQKIIKKQPKLNEHILKIESNAESKFIIFTGIGGAAHSLVRSLNFLKEMNLINNNLKIKKNNYIIFNGNAIGNSPHILYTLTIILKLMEINPKQIFFIKGKYEIKNHWKDFGLKKELLFKFKQIFSGYIPLEKEIQSFLDNLPSAIYISYEIFDNKNSIISSHKNNYIRISHFDRSFKPLSENYYFNFLNKKQIKANEQTKKIVKVEHFKLSKKKFSPNYLEIKAIIKGQDQMNSKKTEGLNIALPDNGASAWIAISGPTTYNQKQHNVKNDSFIILTPGKKELTLYTQDSKKKNGFQIKRYDMLNQNKLDSLSSNKKLNNKKIKQPKKINSDSIEQTSQKSNSTETKNSISEKNILTTGESNSSKNSNDVIRIGTTLDLSASLSAVSKYTLAGLNLKIKHINNNGGINGKKIKLIHLNDRYQPQLALKNIETLLKLGINTILSPIGSYPLRGYLDLAKEEKIAIFFPDATSPEYRNNKIRNIVHYLASSGKESEVLIKYLMKKYTPRKIAFFYKPEPFSLGALNKAKEILKEQNLIKGKDWIEAYHLPGSVDVTEAAEKIKKFNPEAIVLLSSSLPVEKLINKLTLEYLFNKTLLGISSCSGVAFKTFIRNKNLNLINTQLTPNPETSELDIVKEFRIEAEKEGEPLSNYTLTGYIVASIFFNMIEQINGPITNNKIMEIIENIKNYNFKGLNLNFNPHTREISNSVWLDIGTKTFKVD